MTMFTRNDKAPEPIARPTTAPEKADPPAETEIKRPQAVVQPIAPAPQSQGVSIISRALKITGQLESTENIQIDGEVEGDVRGVLVKVGNNAKVKGSVYGDEVELSGTVEGKIEARKVVMTATAHMSGDVIHQDITVQSGAYISGHCRPEYGKSEARTTTPAPKPLAVREQI